MGKRPRGVWLKGAIMPILAAIVSPVITPVFAQASFIRLESNIQLSLDGQPADPLLRGSYSIVNRGDEAAKAVHPFIRIGQWVWTGDARIVAANQSAAWEISEKIPAEQLKCWGDFECQAGGLIPGAPTSGYLPVFSRRYYEDMNGYKFSAAEVLPLRPSWTTPSELGRVVSKQIFGSLTVVGNGQEFRGELLLRNAATESRDVFVTLHGPDELQLNPVTHRLTLPGGGEHELVAAVKNLAGLPGSSYALFAVVEWQEQGVRGVSVVSQAVPVSSAGHATIYLVMAVLLLIAGWLVQRRRSAS